MPEVFGGRYPGSALAIGEEGLFSRKFCGTLMSTTVLFLSRLGQAGLPTGKSDRWIDLALWCTASCPHFQ